MLFERRVVARGKLQPAGEERSWMQLLVYALAAQEIGGKQVSDLTCAYYFLQNGTARPIAVNDETLQGTEARVEELIRSIQMRSSAAPLGYRCRACR